MKQIFCTSVFWQDSIKDKTTSLMFRVLAFADTFALLLGPFQDFVNRVANTGGIENIHNVVCKVDMKNYSYPITNKMAFIYNMCIMYIYVAYPP